MRVVFVVVVGGFGYAYAEVVRNFNDFGNHFARFLTYFFVGNE